MNISATTLLVSNLMLSVQMSGLLRLASANAKSPLDGGLFVLGG
jgi:hypothetical protein